MTKLYPTCMGKLLLSLILPAVFTLSSQAQKMVTYDTTFGGWNAIVTEDVSLQGNDSAAGIVFFPGIGQMTTNVSDLSVNGPHYLINNGLWDGSVTLGNGVHHPFIISLQPPASGYPAATVLPKIQAILARYRIKRNSFYLTGLSCGGWQANEFVAYEPTPGDNSAGMMVKAIVNLEGVIPSDSMPIYPSESYPRKMGHWAKVCGGRELWVEGSQDWRDMLAGAQNMCDSVPNSATYFMVTYGGGAHCCWNTEYEPSVTWTMASNSNISEVVGAQVPMNVWQWMLRQGDTSMPASENVVIAPPTVSAGKGQTITMPSGSTTLTGTATGNGGATITTVSWKQDSGPATATIASASSVSTAVTGMTVVGSYIFTLTATDNHGKSANGSMTVTVDSPFMPVVSAGKGQTISLPVSSTTLTGAATGIGGATITTVSWKQDSGPATATIASSSSVSTTVTGMTVAGSYIFTLFGTDNKGNTANGSLTVTVNPAGKTTAMGVGANAGQAIFMTDSTASGDSAMMRQGESIRIYPNPVRDLLNIHLSNSATGKISVAIFDMKGARVQSLELDKESQTLDFSVDVSRLSTGGMYVIGIITGRERTTEKFIKQ